MKARSLLLSEDGEDGSRGWIEFAAVSLLRLTMRVADRPGDISILTHIYVSDNRTVEASKAASCS